jgi:hypothetical protein
MAWNMPGRQGILTLRSLIQSDRWDAAWKLLQTDFCKKIIEMKTTKTSAATVCANAGYSWAALPLAR